MAKLECEKDIELLKKCTPEFTDDEIGGIIKFNLYKIQETMCEKDDIKRVLRVISAYTNMLENFEQFDSWDV